MKKIFTLLFVAGNILATNAQDIVAGFYHIKNATTGRCMIMTDNTKGATDTQTGSNIDLGAIETNRNAEYVGTHPGAVCYVSPLGSEKYDIAAQGTSISKIGDGTAYLVLTKQSDGTYTITESYGNISVMLGDKSEMDRITGEYNDEGKLVEVSTLERGTWELLPIGTSATGEFIGIKPEVQTADGTWWASFFAEFAFDLHSTGMKAFYVDTANDTEFTLKEITGTIPANTPVLIQCATNDYTQNIIKPKTSNAESIKVLMDGVYFDRTAANHFNAKAYDKNTMRVLGVDDNNNLVFHVAPTSYLTEGKYLSHNKAYLVVTSSAAETLYVKGSNTFTAKCAKPTISMKNGKICFECETEGVEYHYQLIMPEMIGTSVSMPATCSINVYASKEDYTNSDTLTQEIDISGLIGDMNGDGSITVTDVVILLDKILGK